MQTHAVVIMLLLIGIIITAFTFSQNAPKKNEASYQMSKSASSSADVKTVVPSQKPFNITTTIPVKRATPTPTFFPSPTASNTVNLNNGSSVKLESVSPSTGIQDQTIILRGEKFGLAQGKIWFYNPEGLNMGGPNIGSWNDNEIHTKVGFMLRGNRTFYLEVQTADGTRSNKIPFTLTAGQPHVASVSPSTLTRNAQVTIQGTEFGSSQGSVRFYTAGSKSWDETLSATGIITGWSDTSINFTVPSSLESKEYGFQIVTSDNRTTSASYFTIGN